MWDLVVFVPNHWLSIYLIVSLTRHIPLDTQFRTLNNTPVQDQEKSGIRRALLSERGT